MNKKLGSVLSVQKQNMWERKALREKLNEEHRAEQRSHLEENKFVETTDAFWPSACVPIFERFLMWHSFTF